MFKKTLLINLIIYSILTDMWGMFTILVKLIGPGADSLGFLIILPFTMMLLIIFVVSLTSILITVLIKSFKNELNMEIFFAELENIFDYKNHPIQVIIIAIQILIWLTVTPIVFDIIKEILN